MTEYTASSEAIREYMSARERTALWVHTHSKDGGILTFLPPSAPPSAISDPDAPSYGPSDSDEESSRSLPPRMVLRFNDGRPDIPMTTDHIPTSAHTGRRSSSRRDMPHRSSSPKQTPTHSRSKSGSHIPEGANKSPQAVRRHAQTLSYATEEHTRVLHPESPSRSQSPESIVILPSLQAADAPLPPTKPAVNTSHRSQSSQTHSRSASAQAALAAVNATVSSGSRPPAQPQQYNGVPQAHSHQSSHRSIAAPSPRRAFDPSQIPVPSSSPPIAYSHSHPLPSTVYPGYAPLHASSSRSQTQLPYSYSPPAIIYAPSSKHSRSHYTPPAIVYSPRSHHTHQRSASSHAAPSITYSHSAPLPQPPYQSYSGSAQHYPAHGSSHRSGSAVPQEPYDMRHRQYDGSHSRAGSSARVRTPAQPINYAPPPDVPPRSPSPAESDRDSRASGSTYYVLPTAGQKVKLVVPNSGSIYTATSTTKSAHSPRSPRSAHSGSKKPFFQRIFSIPKFPGSAASANSRGSQGKALHGRYTVEKPHPQGRVGVAQR
ncbi:hypothetical protein WOLCODRAFT_139755 [Wolfiporia cocos MD-104 SS10]|uniref:Uncharacterized protein n=1 Tax=Wolfiporia cocos (strain MD-104) TaxID=742152 RepID=A0A2H3JEM0_WOLCO|nr:hypothetical protein WOLCODRAFT_139755 [Wolfiporia cocos MD-104 SS10]